MRDALRDNGIVCCQGECVWLDISLIRSVLSFARRLFPTVQYAYASTPTYPCGQIGFVLCSKEAGKDLSVPVKRYTKDEASSSFRYYNSDVHSAAFVLPQFAKKALFE
jgi:spermidine synthase